MKVPNRCRSNAPLPLSITTASIFLCTSIPARFMRDSSFPGSANRTRDSLTTDYPLSRAAPVASGAHSSVRSGSSRAKHSIGLNSSNEPSTSLRLCPVPAYPDFHAIPWPAPPAIPNIADCHAYVPLTRPSRLLVRPAYSLKLAPSGYEGRPRPTAGLRRRILPWLGWKVSECK